MIRRLRERGSVSVELAILMPGFSALIALSVIGGRHVIAQGAIDVAAYDAARAASIARSAGDARLDAEAAAANAFDRQGLRCRTRSVEVDVSGFGVAIGLDATVSVTVRCEVEFSDVAWVPGVPGSRQLAATFVSPLDRYRSRTG